MVTLIVKNNIVIVDKSSGNYEDFVFQYLVKYEEVRKLDYFNSTKTKKRYKTVKERRNLYVEDSNYIYFPRGILTMIPEVESNFNVIYDEDDKVAQIEIDKERIKNSMKLFQLRQDQVVAVVKCLVLKRGVIQLPTATGKSAIITATIKELLRENPKTKILVLAPTLSTVKNINSTFVNNGLDSKVFGHPDKEVTSSVTTSLVQSLISYSNLDNNFLDQIDAVFYDECLPANSQILMTDGSCKSISSIYDDDSIKEVMSYNIDSHEYEARKILRKFKTPYNNKFWKVYYVSPISGQLEGVSLTPNHKVFTRDRGYVQAKDLTKDDFIKIDLYLARTMKTFLPSTFVKVERVSRNIGSKSEYKYNLEVEGNHNYFASKVLVSNCHHLTCDTWNRLNLLLRNVKYSLGFSALSISKSEIYSRDIRDLSYTSSLVVGASGPVIMHMDPSYYIEKGIIALPIIMRIDHKVQLSKEFDETVWSSLVKNGIMSETRTRKVSFIASIFNKYDRKSLILVSEREHAFLISKFLVSLGVLNFGISFGSGTGYLYGGVNSDGTVCYKDFNSLEVLEMLERGDINIVIGTSHIDEGVDIKQLDCIILAGGGRTDRRIIQRVGRVLRKSKTGKYAYIIDFTDDGSKVLSKHSIERLKLYKDVIGVPQNLLYDRIDVRDVEKEFKKLENL